MAYCLRSLVEILEQVLNPHQHHKNWVLDHGKIPQIQSLLENASFLRDFLANSSPLIQDRIERLEDQIRDAAEKGEDILKSLITTQILSSPNGQSFTISPPDLREVIQVFESVKEETIKIQDESQIQDLDTSQGPDNELRVVSSRRDPNPTNTVVGVTQDLIQLKDRLTSKTVSKLEIVPIVGMGGTGKTTLARILYDEYSSSKSHFDVCAWATVSKDYKPRAILLNLVECVIGKPTDAKESEHLITTLYKSLFSRRYLIVLDDVWSSKAWDDVQRAFPCDNRGSRVILTTREKIVADYVNPKSHPMHLLNKDDSWELLVKKVFGEGPCPHDELEEVGKRIADKCGGLPLAVEVIGGVLSHAKSKDFWERVAHNVSSFIAKEDDRFSGIFSLSFANLPHYLKPCFLYMGGFPEDYKIPASKITKLWVAEGFLNPNGDETLEEAAEIYLKALIDRNLIFVSERKRGSERVKSYGIHDLLRDLCLRKAEDKKFLYFKKLEINYFQEDTLCRGGHVIASPPSYRTLCAFYNLETRRARGFEQRHGDITREWILRCPPFCTRLLHVLDVVEINFRVFPNEILKLVNLRLLALSCPSLPDISILGNLQAFIGRISYANSSMLKIPQLRHVKFMKVQRVRLFVSIIQRFGVLEKLQTLSTIPLKTFKLLLGKIPNLRKLGIHSDCDTSSYAIDLTCFPKLEILGCSTSSSRGTSAFLSNLIFPDSLKKLTLVSCIVPLKVLSTIGMLPNLEVLKVVACFLDSSTWEPCEGEFCQLQYLQLSVPNLVNWLADETHFPQLKHLVLEHCNELEEVPLDFGGIATLEIIEVKECKSSLVDSARRIIEEQRDLGNDSLQFRYEEKPWYECDEDEDDFAGQSLQDKFLVV